jgi:hypothetical protein
MDQAVLDARDICKAYRRHLKILAGTCGSGTW